jgi:ubiquinone/menaquinone biosynthesis C-methylase UbiE
MDEMTAPGYVRAQYSSEGNLETRTSVWRDSLDGRNPATTAAAAIHAVAPSTILEVGCGTGVFAERLVRENPQASVVATDQSPRFVALTVERGVTAQQADVQDLPFDDDTFDVVAALWMLYHVPDLDQALSEVRRVLRPGGLFVAVTNGDDHLADLMRDAGERKNVTSFSTENGAAALRRHFEDTTAEQIATRAVFEDHAAAVAYLASFDATLAAALPPFEGPREYAGATTVFQAR